MPHDIDPLIAPRHTALVVFECQAGLIGPSSHLPGLAAAAAANRMIEHIGALLSVARSAQVRVFYCTVAKRRDGVGNPFNTPLEIRLRARSGEPTAGPDMGDVVADLAPQPGEVVVARQHGMTGFYESGLDAYLRNCGIRTVVLTGVSVNIGILGTAIEAVNHGYTVVVPTDCVAGDPPEYAEQALRYSVRNVAFLSTRAEIEGVWSAGG